MKVGEAVNKCSTRGHSLRVWRLVSKISLAFRMVGVTDFMIESSMSNMKVVLYLKEAIKRWHSYQPLSIQSTPNWLTLKKTKAQLKVHSLGSASNSKILPSSPTVKAWDSHLKNLNRQISKVLLSLVVITVTALLYQRSRATTTMLSSLRLLKVAMLTMIIRKFAKKKNHLWAGTSRAWLMKRMPSWSARWRT